MIQINDDYSFKRGDHCWELHHTKDGINPKTKEPTRSTTVTFHGSILQVCKTITDRDAGMAENLDELVTIIKTTENDLEKVINGSQINIREDNTDTVDSV